ncbi:hypothetical protein N0O92_15505 [Alkalihalobacillus sp. MEB130]|uniref:hypothetical protein n=1 Tax=Alkalihalobacillus sp. MEB130 TaxID=2976704 RepID=UPI0028DFE32A|nr:hypothetical protein [Alkalihalobacillus sp. MEB130]MDT8861624.1 hypothetical protein [Alkalihalobacillus sp. MEB130]
MNKKRNQLAFGLLSVVHCSLLIFTFLKKRNRKELVMLLFSNISFAYWFEYVVLNVFNAYTYRPNFLKSKRLDNIFGAILSQAIFIPFTSLFLSAFQKKWAMKFLVTLYFVGVEMLFLRLKIYKTNWWNPLFTSLAIPVHFYLSDVWYKHIKKGTSFVLSVSLFNMMLVTCVNLLFLLVVFRKFKFGVGKVHSWYEHFLIAPLYSIVFSVFTVKTLKLGDTFSKVKVLVFLQGLDFLLRRFHVVKVNFKYRVSPIFFHIFAICLATVYKRIVTDVEAASKDK